MCKMICKIHEEVFQDDMLRFYFCKIIYLLSFIKRSKGTDKYLFNPKSRKKCYASTRLIDHRRRLLAIKHAKIQKILNARSLSLHVNNSTSDHCVS